MLVLLPQLRFVLIRSFSPLFENDQVVTVNDRMLS